MRVIGAGFPRTGTTSMKAALERLGFGPCHHMVEVLSSLDLAQRWAEVGPAAGGGGGVAGDSAATEAAGSAGASGSAGSAGSADWDRLLGGWGSGVDWPLSFYWRELAEYYPASKIVLTVRDPRRWYTSMRATIFEPTSQNARGLGAGVTEEFRAISPLLDQFWRSAFGSSIGDIPSEEVALAAFERNSDRVIAEIPAERLLVYRPGEGWERLCAFLGTEVPDEPFPHLNDTDTMLKRHAKQLGST